MQTHSQQSGLVQAIVSYTIWGLFPLYWYFLAHLPAGEIMANRIVWSFVLLTIYVIILKRFGQVFAGLRDKKVMLILGFTSILISLNWLLYIWAVSNGYVIEASMGYYINPIVNILLGAIFLGERLRKYQYIAVAFALAGVLTITVAYGRVPIIALSLAVSFGVYSLLRKIVNIGSQAGLIIETGLVLLPAIVYLLMLKQDSTILFGSTAEQLLLVGGGLATLLPLVLLANALKVLPLSTVGFIQYISPTLQFICGLLFFKEPFSVMQGISFLLIWIGLAIYTGEAIFQRKRKKSRLS